VAALQEVVIFMQNNCFVKKSAMINCPVCYSGVFYSLVCCGEPNSNNECCGDPYSTEACCEMCSGSGIVTEDNIDYQLYILEHVL
jgi:hypothetical protein